MSELQKFILHHSANVNVRITAKTGHVAQFI